MSKLPHPVLAKLLDQLDDVNLRLGLQQLLRVVDCDERTCPAYPSAAVDQHRSCTSMHAPGGCDGGGGGRGVVRWRLDGGAAAAARAGHKLKNNTAGPPKKRGGKVGSCSSVFWCWGNIRDVSFRSNECKTSQTVRSLSLSLSLSLSPSPPPPRAHAFVQKSELSLARMVSEIPQKCA